MTFCFERTIEYLKLENGEIRRIFKLSNNSLPRTRCNDAVMLYSKFENDSNLTNLNFQCQCPYQLEGHAAMNVYQK